MSRPTSGHATDLFARIIAFDNLLAAARAALRGKRAKPGAAAFASGLERHLIRLQAELIERRWRSHGYTVIDVRDPKPRRVSAAPFADRVVHHALCRIIAPIFERGFSAESFANRKGFGTHRAVACYENHRNRFRHVLRADIYRFFPAIDHTLLKADLARRIGCEGTRWLAGAVCALRGRLRAVPSRAGRAGRLARTTCKIPGPAPPDPASEEDLHRPTQEPATFLGYVLLPGGHGIRRLPDDNADRFVRRLHGLRDRWRAGTVTKGDIECRIQSWIGHAQQADTKALRRTLFKGGWFDPRRKT